LWKFGRIVLAGPESSIFALPNILRSFRFSVDAMWAAVSALNLMKTVPSLKMPVSFWDAAIIRSPQKAARHQSSIPARGESPSLLACNWPSESEDITIFVLVSYVKPRRWVARNAVQFQQLGDKGSQLLSQSIG
jgi:hypothetical protein